jgi:hypothetical protein
VIDGAYVVGWNFARQTAFRVTKNYNNKVWTAFEVANPETVYTVASGQSTTNVFGLRTSSNVSEAVTGTGTSTNLAPDLLAKATFEPGYGHYELKALGRFFRDRYNNVTNVTEGGGIGAAASLPVVRGKVDFLAQTLVGAGIGRYGTTAGPDVTIRPSDNALVPIRSIHLEGGFELHPTAKIDVFAYGGDEYYQRTAYLGPGNTAAGYGSPLVNNSTCNQQLNSAGTAISSCPANNRDIAHGSAGVWYRLFKGPFGTLQYGAQYSFVQRSTWSAIGGAPAGNENIAYSSFRIILP